MIEINNKDDQKTELKESNSEPQKPVNESSGIYIRSYVKITDPDSGEILVQTAD
jgi:hypothetical protein